MINKIDEFTARKIAAHLCEHGYKDAGEEVKNYIDMFIKHDLEKVKLIDE